MIYYHLSHIDLDGYSAQYILNDSTLSRRCFNANYGQEVIDKLEAIVEYIKADNKPAAILITDLNLSLDESSWLDSEVKKLQEKIPALSVTLLDHHGSGKNCAQQYEWYHLDTSRSATKITYDYAITQQWIEPSSEKEAYVNMVNAVDLWLQHEEKNFEFGKVCMRLIHEARELNRVIFADLDREYKHALLAKAQALLHKERANILLDNTLHSMKKEFFLRNDDDTLDNLSTRYIVEEFGKQKEHLTIYYKGYRGLLTYSVGNTSIIGNGFLNRFPDFDFVLDVGPRGTMSLRANNCVDVSLIAKELAGGGGHPNASGGRIKEFREQYRYDKVKEFMLNLFEERSKRETALAPKA